VLVPTHPPHFPRRRSPLGAAQEQAKAAGRHNARLTGLAIVAMALVTLLGLALMLYVTRAR
jgi:hypothetical protein